MRDRRSDTFISLKQRLSRYPRAAHGMADTNGKRYFCRIRKRMILITKDFYSATMRGTINRTIEKRGKRRIDEEE